MQCVTVTYGEVRGSAKKYPYFQAALYEAAKTKDGRIVWRYVQHLARPRRSANLAKKDAMEFINEERVFISEVRHNSPVIIPEEFLINYFMGESPKG